MTLLLDPDIRDWVVLPLFVIMVAAGLLRHWVGLWLQPDKAAVSVLQQRQQSVMRQTTKIRSGAAHFMSTWKWYARKQHYVVLLQQEAVYCETQHAKQQEEIEKNGNGSAVEDSLMNNPLNMMKGNMAFMVQNMVMMQGIQHFFSGFILLRVPFSLTAGFKSMFQRGVAELPDLDPAYVSSVSWYFLVMYGLRSFFRLVIGEPTLEYQEQEALLQQMGYATPAGAKPWTAEDAVKQLKQEADNLEVFLQQHKSEIDGVEKRLLGKQRYPKKKLRANDEADFLLSGVGKTKKKNKAV